MASESASHEIYGRGRERERTRRGWAFEVSCVVGDDSGGDEGAGREHVGDAGRPRVGLSRHGGCCQRVWRECGNWGVGIRGSRDGAGCLLERSRAQG